MAEHSADVANQDGAGGNPPAVQKPTPGAADSALHARASERAARPPYLEALIDDLADLAARLYVAGRLAERPDPATPAR